MDKEYHRKWREANPEKVREARRRHYEKNKTALLAKQKERRQSPEYADKHRNNKFRSQYGISVAERDAMLAAQGGVCAICGTDTPRSVGWVIDHCHSTGVVRGILCNPCNLSIGLMKDDPTILKAGAEYLLRHKELR